jgi:hypothetical protein
VERASSAWKNFEEVEFSPSDDEGGRDSVLDPVPSILETLGTVVLDISDRG